MDLTNLQHKFLEAKVNNTPCALSNKPWDCSQYDYNRAIQVWEKRIVRPDAFRARALNVHETIFGYEYSHLIEPPPFAPDDIPYCTTCKMHYDLQFKIVYESFEDESIPVVTWFYRHNDENDIMLENFNETINGVTKKIVTDEKNLHLKREEEERLHHEKWLSEAPLREAQKVERLRKKEEAAEREVAEQIEYEKRHEIFIKEVRYNKARVRADNLQNLIDAFEARTGRRYYDSCCCSLNRRSSY
jgi:hypothetical protein